LIPQLKADLEAFKKTISILENENFELRKQTSSIIYEELASAKQKISVLQAEFSQIKAKHESK
jgi:hypothetical protein